MQFRTRRTMTLASLARIIHEDLLRPAQIARGFVIETVSVRGRMYNPTAPNRSARFGLPGENRRKSSPPTILARSRYALHK